MLTLTCRLHGISDRASVDLRFLLSFNSNQLDMEENWELTQSSVHIRFSSLESQLMGCDY